MWNWIKKLEELQRCGTPAAVVTITQVSGSVPREAGAKMIALASGTFFGTIGGGNLEDLALKDAHLCLEQKKTTTFQYPLGTKAGQCCGGLVEVLVETVNTGPKLYLFGAGHVGQAVARTLEGTPFVVHIVDDRPEWIQSENLPPSVVRHAESWEKFVAYHHWDNQSTYVAVMTHSHALDHAIIQHVVERPARYIGLIGSRTKWARFTQRLTADGVTAEELARVTCPLGLFKWGKAPQEIAISLASELLKLHYGEQRVVAEGATEEIFEEELRLS